MEREQVVKQHQGAKSGEDLRSRVAELRADMGLTQLELSELCGVTPNTVANWESARRGLVWFLRMARLCASLNCSLEDLLESTEPLRFRISVLRKQVGLTQLELSRQCEVTQNTVANWEKNRNIDWFLTVVRLCKVLNCKPEDLLQEVPPIKVIEPVSLSSSMHKPNTGKVEAN